jgi:DnaJ-class molecular chaperone
MKQVKQDLYQLLGLRRDASPEEIKKAYRELAKRHHPDRTQNNPQDTEIFKAVSVAFATLSNPAKRATYDRELAATERKASPQRRQTRRPVYQEVRRQATPFGDILGEFFQGWGGVGPPDREERAVEIVLTPGEAQMGVTVPLEVPWKFQCPSCRGSGLAPFSICRECRGSGSTYSEKRMELSIPPGIRSGTAQRLCFAHNRLTILVQVKIR